MKRQLFEIKAVKPSNRRILAAYNETGLLTGFKIEGDGWTDSMLEKMHKLIPLKTSLFAGYKERFNLTITDYKK